MWNLFKKQKTMEEITLNWMQNVKEIAERHKRPKAAKLEFLRKLYPALIEFEGITGVRVNSIIIHREILPDNKDWDYTYTFGLE